MQHESYDVMEKDNSFYSHITCTCSSGSIPRSSNLNLNAIYKHSMLRLALPARFGATKKRWTRSAGMPWMITPA
eukprot:596475-Pleurochrysis_carterae.AAC.1